MSVYIILSSSVVVLRSLVIDSRFSRRAWDGAVRQWKLRVHAESRKFLESSPGSGPRPDVKIENPSKPISTSTFEIDHQRRDDLDLEDHYASKAASENAPEKAVDTTMDVKQEYKLVDRETLHPLTAEKEKEEDDIDKASKSKVKIITI